MSAANKCSWLISLCGCAFLLALTFGAVGYAMGWIDFANEPETTTIEIDKKELKSDAREAAEATEEFFGDTGEELQDAAESLSDDSAEAPKSDADQAGQDSTKPSGSDHETQ